METKDEQLTDLPDDFAEYQRVRDGQPSTPKEQAPAAGEEETPPSEPADEAGQSDAESETAEEAEQVEEQEEEKDEKEETPKPEKDNRMSKRMRKLSGEIAALEARLAELTGSEADDETPEEVASSTEESAEPAAEAEAPMLRDFEDNDETGETAFDQWQKAMRAFNKAETEKAIATALDKQKKALEQEHSVKVAQEAWNREAARFPDFNEVVRADVQISAAMESVMRMDPVSGTELAYYLGQHPEESVRIAKATLANNESEWQAARVRAGVELGEIKAKLKAEKEKGPKPAPSKTSTSKTPAPPPKPKQVTSASKPPTTLRPAAAAPKFDLLNEDDAADTAKWLAERERQLAAKPGRR